MPERALTVTFLGNTAGLEAAMKRTAAQLNGLQAAGASMQSLGRSMTRNLTVPIIGVGAAAASMAVKFQASMEQLHTQAGVSQRAIAGLSRGVLDMAGTVGSSPEELARAMYHVASSLNATLPAATRSATELRVLKVAAQGAAVGHADLTDVTNALDAAVVSGIRGVQNFSQAMGGLNSIVGAGDMTMQNLADALSTGLLAPMQTYGLTLKDVGGALATFGDNNLRGQEAATKLISAVRIMAAPSKAAAKELGGIGLSTLQLANDMRSGGLVGALEDLRKHLKSSGDTASQQGLVIARAFGGRQSTGVQVLLSQLDRLQAKTQQVGDGAKGFGAAWAATQQTAAFKLHSGLASMQADLTRFGDDVLPTLLTVGGTIVKDVDKVAHAFTSLPRGAQDAIIKGGLVLAAIGPAMKILGLFTGGIGKLWAIASKIQAWGAISGTGGAGGALAAAERTSTVATMNVGSLIARSLIGAAPGAGTGRYQPFGLGTAPATIPTPAAGPEAAVVETGMTTRLLSNVKSGLSTVLSGAMRGLMIGGLGTLAAEAIGSSIHGAVGKAVASIGKDAAIGAGLGAVFGPPGVIPGALLGSLVGAVKMFIGRDAAAEGKAWADKFTSSLPGTLSKATRQGLADAAARQRPTAPREIPAEVANAIAVARGTGPVDTKADSALRAHWVKEWEVAFNAVFNFGFTFGKKTGDAFVQSMSAVKHPSGSALLGNMLTELKDVPKNVRAAGATAVQAWRDEAAKEMLAYASSLQQHGKLPRGALNSVLAGLKQQFPGLTTYLQQAGLQNETVIAKAMKLSAAQKNLRGALDNFRIQFDYSWQFAKTTNSNINANTARAMLDLKYQMGHGPREGRLAAKHEYDLLRTQVAQTWAALSSNLAAKQAAMTTSIIGGSKAAATTAVRNYNTFATGVKDAMARGALSVQQGTALINAALASSASALVVTGGTFASFVSKVQVQLALLGKQHSVSAKALGAQPVAHIPSSITASPASAASSASSPRSTSSAAANVPSVSVPPAATPIPSQLVAAQTRMAELANRLTIAQNAGNLKGQASALNAELKLEQSWLAADRVQLEKVNHALADGNVSLAKHTQLLQDKLALTQEIGTVLSGIGSAQQSLSGVAGVGAKMPKVYYHDHPRHGRESVAGSVRAGATSGIRNGGLSIGQVVLNGNNMNERQMMDALYLKIRPHLTAPSY